MFLKFFTVEGQVDRAINFLIKTVDRLNNLSLEADKQMTMHFDNIGDLEDAVHLEEYEITKLRAVKEKTERIRGKLEELVS